MNAIGFWEHHTVETVFEDDDALGLRMEDRTWRWIPRPPIPVAVGDRISVFHFQPHSFSVRFVIGEMEVPTYYAQEMKRREQCQSN